MQFNMMYLNSRRQQMTHAVFAKSGADAQIKMQRHCWKGSKALSMGYVISFAKAHGGVVSVRWNPIN